MIEIYKSNPEESAIIKIDQPEKNCWINLTHPSGDEIGKIASELQIPADFLAAALDEEERPRLEYEDGVSLILIDIPRETESDMPYLYDTLPLGIIIKQDHIVTICLSESPIIRQFIDGRIKSFFTSKKTRFLFLILYHTAKQYLKYLRIIDRKSTEFEEVLKKSIRNEALLTLMNLQKSLVFFSTSLKSNEIVLEKIMKSSPIQFYEEDVELLDDVIIENKQAIEMANIYTTILTGTMDAFASIINNNMNAIIKILASITIILSIPTIVTSFFGMNVGLPLEQNPLAYVYIILFAAIICFFLGYILKKKDFL
ncbi:magnesium transporter CorA family protein [Methanolacinia paynteri]|uniref:magnesium transporter CorA family protein n=2 Tax=Methanolacinia TaxID=230355 RepID=UPI00064FD860|nr:magnesium transporter CorA family protein [Methanolacinia paynteri]